MSQLAKVLQVIDLFSSRQPTLAAEQVAEQLQISRPTAFRYLRQLCEAGLLLNLSGRYALGARIIELDYRIRESDPILANSRDALRSLANMNACVAVLVSIYGEQIIHVHSEAGLGAIGLGFGRGRTLPLFRGAPSKAILAHLPTPRLKKLYERHAATPDVQAMGVDWSSFLRHLRDSRAPGYHVSRGEVEAHVTGVAAPIFTGEGVVTSSLVLAFDHVRHTHFDIAVLGPMVQGYAREVTARIAQIG